jgi:hypothetical protein
VRAWLGTLTLAACALAAPGALAQQKPADQLFQEGVHLFERGEVKTACEKFAQSYQLDAAPGTLYNLASCHEKEGKLGQARREFLELADRAANVGKQDKARAAQDRAKAIEARLPRLVLQLPAANDVAAITVDGTPVPKEAWAAPIPVDDGTHALQFSASGKVAQTARIEAHGAGQQVLVPVPVLADEAGAASAAAASPEAAAQTAGQGQPAPSAPESAAAQPSGGGSGRTIGFVVGGVGIAALAAGTFFGIRALSQKSDADTACAGQNSVCPDSAHTQAAQSDLNNARTSGLVSTVAIGVGVAAVAVGAYLVFFTGGHSTESAHAALAVTPSSLFLSGSF